MTNQYKPNRPRVELLCILDTNNNLTPAVDFPQDLKPGDQVILLVETQGLEVKKNCKLVGHSENGPILEES